MKRERERKQALYKNVEEVCGTSASNDILLGVGDLHAKIGREVGYQDQQEDTVYI